VIVLLGALVFALLLAGPMHGRLSRLAHVRFRSELLVPAGLLLQVTPPALSYTLGRGDLGVVTLASWLAGAFALVLACGLNWEHVGFRLAALGIALNVLVIALNGGMPVSVAALSYMGVTGTEQQMDVLTPLYHLGDAQTVLMILGDVMPVPGPQLIRSVVSLGDLILMVGVAVVVLDTARALAKSR
jgi:hypothetical protein